ncbi:MAG: class I SAM-dependent methyltransferase, partial [bacterium]
MGFYQRFCVPMVIDFACGLKPIRKQREKVVPKAEGRILEVGIGSGLNLPWYDPAKVERVFGLEPDPYIRKRAEKRVKTVPFEVEFLDLPGEEIPLADKSVDTVLITYTLCTIPGWQAALHQMRRVLKPGGRMLFCEHSRAPDPGVAKWQDRLNPIWRPIAGGCNMNRPMTDMITGT